MCVGRFDEIEDGIRCPNSSSSYTALRMEGVGYCETLVCLCHSKTPHKAEVENNQA